MTGVPLQSAIDVRSSAALPALCTCDVSSRGAPMTTVWKSSEAGSRLTAGPAAPVAVPLTPRLIVGFAGSLLATARQARGGRAPAAVGAKVALRLAPPPAATVNGPVGVRVIELGVPAQDETLVTFSGAVPVFCTWVLSVLELPTVTIWKFSEVGLRTMAGAGVFVPVPASPRLRVGFAGSLLARARQAPAGRAPAVVGAKVTLRLALPPAATVNGPGGVRVIELGVPAQDETLVTFSGAVPVFCTWVLSVLELPTVTIWKFSEVGLRTMAAAGVFVP